VPESVGFVERNRLGAFYARAAVVCVPSRREGYGRVAREAMAYGRPVVAAAVGGLVDAISHGETGLLVPSRDNEALRGALMHVLEDEELRRRLGEAACRRARQEAAEARSKSAELYSLPFPP
jgi:glycosyltransferase involved in cell wall biosynthesis